MKRVGYQLFSFCIIILLVGTNLIWANKGQPSTKGFTWADSQDVLFAWIEISADPGATLLSTAPDPDTMYTVTLPVDFSFNFYNRSYSTFYVSDNGYITFHNYGATSFPSNNNLNRTGVLDSVIAVFWDSLSVGTFGNVYFEVKGVKPYRKAVIEYQNISLLIPGGSVGPLTFEIVLYETTNLIKFQYLELGGLTAEERGSSATIGLKFEAATFDSLQYSVNTASLSQGLAVLFYPSDNLLATSTLTPIVVAPGTSPQSFRYTVNNVQFQLLADSLERMGKADVLRIKNEINTAVTDPITVTSVVVDGQPFFILDTLLSPKQLGLEGPHATWYYDNATDSLFIRTTAFAVRDSISIVFQENIPTSPGIFHFRTDLYAELHPSQGVLTQKEFSIVANSIDHYVFTPTGVDSFLAGASKTFTLQALDQYNNPVTNTESVNLSAIGSNTVVFSRGTPVAFNNSDTIMFSISDTVVENFRVLAENVLNTNATGLSGIQKIKPAAPASLVTLSSTAPITVGTSRLLQVRVEDQYGNVHPDSSLKFKKISAGDGTFSNGLDSIIVLTNTSGVGEATFTASSLTSFVGDTIQVSIGALSTTIILPLQANAVSSYQFNPATSQTTTAGSGVAFTLTAVDTNGNPVVNSQKVVLTSLSGTGVTFSPNDTLTFVNQSSVNFTVTDTVAETFFVLAQNLSGTASKQSPSITVQPAAPASLVTLSSTAPITVGTSRLLQVRVEDQYGNVHPDSSLKFKKISAGDGTFSNGLDSIIVLTNTSGVGEATFTASSLTSFVGDTIQVSIGALSTTIILPLQANAVSSYQFNPATSQTTTAGSGVAFTLTAVDTNGNPVVNSQKVVLTSLSGTGVTFSPNDTLTFVNQSSVNFTVTDTVAETFFVLAQNLSGTASKQSPSITVQPAAPNHFVVLSAIDSITVGTSRLLSVKLQDIYGNIHPDSLVLFRLLNGDSRFNLNQLDTLFDRTNTNGIAEASYRASTLTSFLRDSIQVSYGTSVLDTILIPLKAGPISNFQLTLLSTVPDTAGSRIQIQIKALDVYGNGVLNSQQYQMSAIGSATAQFFLPGGTIPTTTFTFSSDSLDTVDVRDLTAGSFVAQASLVSDPSRQGVSNSIQILPASLAELRLRSQAGNKGILLSNFDSTFSSTAIMVLYAAGYDRNGNYINDIDSSVWKLASGNLQPTPPVTFPFTGASLTFDPDSLGSGRLFVSIPTTPKIIKDTTGVLTITTGALASLKIQTDSLNAATEVGNRTFTAGQTLTMFAVGYDADNNRIATVSSNWTLNNSSLGQFNNGLPTLNGARQVTFTALQTGSGVVTTKAVSDTTISDQTGLFTVNGSAIDSIVIRNAANNGGIAYNSLPLTITADTTITLYAAGYDAQGNFISDTTVTWGSIGLTGVPAGPASSIVFNPSTVQSGRIFTQTGVGVKDDTTALITIQPGALADVRIQNNATGSGIEVDTVTLHAGLDTTLFVGGYDSDNNFISTVTSNWSLEGASIGFFSQANPSTFNLLTVDSVGSAVVRATQNGGSLTDITSTITVLAGTADSLVKFAALDSQAAPVNSRVPNDIEIQVLDAFGNPVPNHTVHFVPQGGGSVSPATATTNALGIASTAWTVHSTPTTDSLAIFVAETTRPDTVKYYALVTSGTATTLSAVQPDTGIGTVDTDLTFDFKVLVLDSLANPVPGVIVSWSIISFPVGASNQTLSVFSDTTNKNGNAVTRLHLGTKAGTYIVRASTATTTPNFVDFYGIAQADTASQITVIFGNSQSDTINHTLIDSIKFKVADRFSNIVSNQTVVFNPLQGSVNPTTAASNASGVVATAWTLGSLAGTQQLTASLQSSPTVVSDTVTATALPGLPATLSLVTMRKLPNDSIAAVSGENVTTVLQVQDIHGNKVSGASVKFQSLPGYNVLFESSQLTTNSNGQVTNVVKTDVDSSRSFFRALIPGTDTLNLHIFHLSYVNGSLLPVAASPGDTVAFQVQLQNNSPFPVILDTASTRFRFNDGLHTFSAALHGAVTIPALSAGTLNFDSAVINSNFTNTGYAPEVFVKGSGADSLLSGSVFLPSNVLSIFKVEITQLTATTTNVARGDTFLVTVFVNNLGPDTVTVNTLTLSATQIPPANFIPPASFGTLLPNSVNNQFVFQAIVPINAALGSDTINAQLTGTDQNGLTVFAGSATSPLIYTIKSNALLSLQSISPTTVTNGDTFSLQMQLLNTGQFTAVLNPDSSVLTFGSDVIPLSQGYSVPPGVGPPDAITATFAAHGITSLANAVPYPAQLRLYGTENGALLDTTLVLSDSFRVQNPPNVIVSLLNVVPDTTSQNQDSVITRLVLLNSGALNAPAVISKPDSITLSTTQLSAITPSSASLGLFPITLKGDSSTQVIEFVHSLSQTYPTGVDTARVQYSFTDNNSSHLYQSSPANFDVYQVLSRSQLTLIANSDTLSPKTVVPGQSGVRFTFSIRNDGQAPAIINNGDVSVQFNNPHTITLVSPTLPDTLKELATRKFVYDITVANNATIGIDPVDVAISYADSFSGKIYSDVQANDLDTLTILTAPDSQNVQIQFVSIIPVNVNQGQTGISAVVRLQNLSQSTVWIDSLFLVMSRGGISQNLNTIPGTIPPNGAQNFSFTLTVADTTSPGTVGVDASYTATDMTSGTVFSHTGALVSDTVNVLIPANFTFTPIVISPDTVSEGQSGISVTATLVNGNSNTSAADITALQLSFDQGAGDITAVLQNPVPLPTVPGGDSVQVQFSLSIADPATFLGLLNVNMIATGLDQTDSRTFADTSLTPATMVIQQKGQIVVDSVRTAVTQAVPGQGNIPVEVFFRNPGQAAVDITPSGSQLYFNGTTANFFQNLDSLGSDPLAGGLSDTAFFTISVLDNAPLGSYAVTAKISGVESNTGIAVSDSAATVSEIDSISVVTPGDLRLLSVVSPFDSVSIGSDSVTVAARVKNFGSSTVKVDSLKLTFTSGIYQFGDTTFTPPIFLTSGGTMLVNFPVTVPAGNTPQSHVVIDGEVYGSDLTSGNVLSDLNADTVDVWQLVTPGNLILQSIAPDSVSNGETVSFVATVQNTGQANLTLSATGTILQLKDNSDADMVQTALGHTQFVAGNSTVSLTFPTVTVNNFTPGVLPANLFANNYQENGFTRSDTLISNAISVFDSALVVIDSTLAPGTISQDMNIPVDIFLRNNGANNAVAVIDSVVISTFNFRQTINNNIPANNTLHLLVSPLVDTTFSGLVNYSVDVYWHDPFIAHRNVVSALKSVTVLRKAVLQITNITHPAQVTAGQTSIPVSVTVSNTGEITALMDTITFQPTIGLYQVTPPAAFPNIAPGENQTYHFTIDVFPNSATGVDSIGIAASGTDSISSTLITGTSSYNWTIEGPSDVQILSVVPSQSTVSQGQQSIPVNIIFKNFGGSSTRIDSSTLVFRNGNINYTRSDTGNVGLIVPPGIQDTLRLLVDVDPAATTGNDILDAKAFFTDLVSGVPDSVTSANTTGSWSVQQRPIIAVPQLSINADTASTGENNLILSFQVNNTGGSTPTATAKIDSIQLVVNGLVNDSSNITFVPQFSLPVNLANNSSLNFNYNLGVRATALSGQYIFAATVFYKDLNDNSAFNLPAAAGASDTLTVQQRARLSITRMVINPDSAVTGQNNVAITITGKNTGEAAAKLISSNLIQHNSNFSASLQTIGFPFTLQQHDSIDVLYLVNVPNLVLTNPDSLIHFGATLQGTDVNSGGSLTTQRDSLSILTVVKPANISFDTLLSTSSYNLGDTAQVSIRVFNNGGGTLILNSATQLRLEKVGDPTTVVIAPIDTNLSTLRMAGGDTALVFSQKVVMTKSGTFRLFLDAEGTVFQQSYSQVLNTQTNINIGGDIFINQVTLDDPDGQVFPGQDSINVFVKVINNSLTSTIDAATLTFTYVDNGQVLGIIPVRLDTLTQIPPTGANGVNLQWYFNVPITRTGDVRMTVNIDLNGNTINIFDNSTIFTIVSGVTLSYLNTSITPDTVVQGEGVSFQATFLNSGNTSLLVNPDSSFLQFTDGNGHLYQAFVNGNFTIVGTTDTIPDSSVVSFSLASVDTAFLSGLYPVDFTLKGTLPNGDIFKGFTTSAPNQVRVIDEARLTVDSIDVLPTTIIAGQTNVAVRYYLRNSGTSPASLTQAASEFVTATDSSITNQWIAVSQSHPIPFNLAGGDTSIFIRRFNVSQAIDTGLVKARINLTYNDTRKPNDSKQFSNNAVFDSVRVLQPSSILIDSLTLVNVPNAANHTVNYGQAYDLALKLRNTGSDDLHQIVVELLANEVSILLDTLTAVLPSGGTLQTNYSFTAGTISETISYRAVLRQAISVTSGTPVTIDQPLDNIENVTVQEPTRLTLSAVASGDSLYSIGQVFTIRFTITTTGESPFDSGRVEINLPSNYTLDAANPDSQITISPTSLSGSWQVVALDTTVGASDIITINYPSLPTDLNTNTPVDTANSQADVAVQTVPVAAIQVASIQLTAPPGATDDTLSSGQQFRLRARFNFIGNVAPQNRRAFIVLPPGFLAVDSLDKRISGDSAHWNIAVDNNAGLSALNKLPGRRNQPASLNINRSLLENARGGMQSELEHGSGLPGEASGKESMLIQQYVLQVKATARDGNSQQPISDSLDHIVQVVDQARMVIHAEIADPPGARLGTISTSQTFEVRIWVDNIGEAGVDPDSLNFATVIVPPDFTIEGRNPGESQPITLLTGLSNAAVVRVIAPDTIPAVQPLIQVRLDSATYDENSNRRATIQDGLASLNITVEKKATLSIDNLATDIQPVARNQVFNLQGQLVNSGDADVEPGDTVYVQLDADPAAFQLLNPATNIQPVKLVNKQATVSWQMQSKIDAPFGAYPIIATIIDSLSYDEHNYPDSSVFTLKGQDSVTVNVVDVGTVSITEAYLNTPGTDSLTASTRQTIRVVAKTQFQGTFTNQNATLLLPSIFTIDSLTAPIVNDSVSWNLPIPDSVTVGFTQLTVKVRGTSQVNGQVLTATQQLYLRVKQRAALVLSSQITGGAIDNTVSFGQEFVYQAVISNLGEVGVLPGSPAKVKVSFGDSLQLIQGSLPEQDFTIDQPVVWHFRAINNPKMASLKKRIKTLQHETTRIIRETRRLKLQKAMVEGEVLDTRRNELKQRQQEVETELSRLYSQLSGIIDSSYIRVQITAVPLDSNALTPADTVVGTNHTTIFIAERPTINISDVQLPLTWSTHQSGEVALTIQSPSNVINRSAQLVLPPGFSYTNPADSVKYFGQNTTVSWTILAPPAISQGTLTENLHIDVSGNDQFNDTVTVVQSLDTLITIQQEAKLDLRLASGATITTRQISRNKEFTIRARIERQGAAGISGNTRVRLYDPSHSFQFVDNDSIKVFDNIPNIVNVSWRLRAPDININSAILGIGFIQLPIDENTQQPVALLNDSVTVVVNLVSNRLQVDTFAVERASNNFVQGTPNVPVYGLIVRNPNAFDKIFVRGLTLSVREDPGDSLVVDYRNLINRVRLVRASYYFNQLAKISVRDILGEVAMDTASNPFTLHINPPDTSVAGETDSLMILIDLADKTLNRKFLMRLEDMDAFQIVEGDIIPVEVVDFNGVPLQGFFSKFTSEPLTVLSPDPAKFFGNYPNPFGLDTKIPGAPRGTTRFTFLMKEDGEVDLRIYTLLGGLVWSSGVIDNLAKGSHTGNELLWDGKNGRGRYVVNGVYVAVLRIRYRSGQSEVFKTKVVFIK